MTRGQLIGIPAPVAIGVHGEQAVSVIVPRLLVAERGRGSPDAPLFGCQRTAVVV